MSKGPIIEKLIPWIESRSRMDRIILCTVASFAYPVVMMIWLMSQAADAQLGIALFFLMIEGGICALLGLLFWGLFLRKLSTAQADEDKLTQVKPFGMLLFLLYGFEIFRFAQALSGSFRILPFL
ncbi:MAG: hypothetical protein AAGK14_03815 [Verrucomicrobiota bacterium]